MKRDEVPVSLFSFQDIVTSLIGIMVIVILVIALQMIEAVQEVAESAAAKDNPYSTLIARRAAILNELAKLEAGEASEEEEALKPFLELSLTQLEHLVAKLEEEGKDLENFIRILQDNFQKAKDAAKASAANAQACRRQLAESQRRLAELRKQCEEAEKALAKQQADLDRLLQERDAVQDAIARKSSQLAFAFAGRRTHTPLLVECLGDGFRAAVYPPEGKCQDFTQKSFSGNLKNLCAWLKTFDAGKYYPVLLYRKEAISRSHEIEQAIQQLDKGFRIGRDPVPSSITVF